jgi:hypothetical protein
MAWGRNMNKYFWKWPKIAYFNRYRQVNAKQIGHPMQGNRPGNTTETGRILEQDCNS